MTFHELATNAAKYGAFAQPNGTVYVTWDFSENKMLVLTWKETGGQSLEPVRIGFGTRLIETNIVHQLGGEIERHWEATGLLLKVRIPLTNIQA